MAALESSQLELIDAILSDHYHETLYPTSHLCIYRNNILSGIIHALHDTYPLLVKLLGDDFFRQTAKDYYKHYPSRSGNLHEYGEYMSAFLANYQPVSHLPYLSEVAQFEWFCHTLFFAATPQASNMLSLTDISPDQYHKLHLVLHPVSQLMKCRSPLLQIIDLCNRELNETIDMHAGGVHVLIIRKELDISLMPLDENEFIFLSALIEHQSVAKALNLALQINPKFELDQKLPLWVENKIISF